MPRRGILSKSQRARFEALPTDERDLIRLYSLSPKDQAEIRKQRQAHNKLGFAVQLCLLRYPGRSLISGEQVPTSLVAFVARQLGLRPEAFSKYALRDETRREHLAILQKKYGFVSFTESIQRDLAGWLLPLALRTDKGMVLVASLIQEMRRRCIIVPALSVIERLGSEVRRRAQRQIFKTLTNGLSKAQREKLDRLLEHHPDKKRLSWLGWLRKPSGRPTPANFLSLLERIEFVRSCGMEADRALRVHQNRLLQLAREGYKANVIHLRDLEPQRRRAVLVAVLLETSISLVDEAMDMHDRIIGSLMRRSQRRHAEEFQKNARSYNDKVRLYALVGKALINARLANIDPYEAIQAVVSWEMLCNSIEEAEKLADDEPFDYLALLDNRYSQIRRYAPQLLASFEFRATGSSQDLLEAIQILKELNTSGRRGVPDSAPTTFVKPRWRPFVLTEDGVDRHYYELCVLTELRNSLRSGDVWVVGSRRYRDFEEYLLPSSVFERMAQEGSLPVATVTDCRTYLEQRRVEIHTRLRDVCHLAARDRLEDVRFENGLLRITPLKRDVPNEVDELNRRIYALLPRIKITELLAEVDSWTGMNKNFTHLRSSKTVKDIKLLLTAILADAINLGVVRMADACPEIAYHRLSWVADWHIREETYSKALADVVDFHHKVPFAAHWGAGTTSSSDGQRFRAGARGEAVGQINARYGYEPSVMFYTHISDQFSPFYATVINATARDATHVLDGLLYHESSLRIEEHYTDTAGFTDHVFALCHLLGFRFAPRIRGLADNRIASFDKPAQYPELQGLLGGRVNTRLVAAQWTEILRLATSIKTGTVTASLILRKLGAYPRQNSLAQALRELGRVERTLYTLDWLSDPALRRRAQVGLNKGEAKNALSRAVFFNRLGEVRDRSYEDQRQRASGLNLVVASIILWNTLYLSRAVEALHGQGHDVPDELLAHLSPLGWGHINLTGDYSWRGTEPLKPNEFRPLRLKREDQ